MDRGRLAVEADGARCIALLSVLSRRPLEEGILRPIEAAAAYWAAGDKALANLRLVFSGLPTLGSAADADRVESAAWCLDRGLAPRGLMKSLGLDPSVLDLRKFDPNGRPRSMFRIILTYAGEKPPDETLRSAMNKFEVARGDIKPGTGPMTTIRLDASTWTRVDDFYDARFAALRSPDWHGRNVNALVESLVWGDINAVEPPLRIEVWSTQNLAPDSQERCAGPPKVFAGRARTSRIEEASTSMSVSRS